MLERKLQHQQQVAAGGKDQRKTRRVETAGFLSNTLAAAWEGSTIMPSVAVVG
jgi:hypothetical protein